MKTYKIYDDLGALLAEVEAASEEDAQAEATSIFASKVIIVAA